MPPSLLSQLQDRRLSLMKETDDFWAEHSHYAQCAAIARAVVAQGRAELERLYPLLVAASSREKATRYGQLIRAEQS